MSIEAIGLSKTYGKELVVGDVSFQVNPGEVVGFVGPNGAGKTTTMRLMLGLAHADAGQCLFDGQPYGSLDRPLGLVGTAIGGTIGHPRRRLKKHLRAWARSNAISEHVADDVLEQVGLGDAGQKRVGSLSLGMGQRLALAEALIGNPKYLMLDEPFTGLDMDGIRWLRSMLRELAAQGTGILFSNHHMAEMELLADRLVIIGSGRVLADDGTGSLIAGRPASRIRVASYTAPLIDRLRDRGFNYAVSHDGIEIQVDARRTELLGVLAEFPVSANSFREVPASLEEVFLEIVGSHTQYSAMEVVA